jgi:hypothetical protein
MDKMKHSIGALVLLAGAFAGSGAVLAQPTAPVIGPQQPPPGISQAISGTFNVIQIETVDVPRFQAAWSNRKEEVSLPTSGTTRRNQPINSYIIFNGCKVDARGNCIVYTDFEVYDPDGEVYAKHAAQPQWLGPPDPSGRIMLGVSGLNLVVENGEKLGTYHIRTFTIDKVANVSVSNEVAVSVVEAK